MLLRILQAGVPSLVDNWVIGISSSIVGTKGDYKRNLSCNRKCRCIGFEGVQGVLCYHLLPHRYDRGQYWVNPDKAVCNL